MTILKKRVVRLSKAAREFNVGIQTILDYLAKKGVKIESSPNTKLEPDVYDMLVGEFMSQKKVKEEADKIGLDYTSHETISIKDKEVGKREDEAEQEELFIKNLGVGIRKEEEPPKKVVKEEVKAAEEKKAVAEEEKVEPAEEKAIGKPEAKKEDKEATKKEVKEEAEPEKKPVTKKEEEPATPKEEDKKVVAEAKEEKPEKEEKKTGLKVLGKLDLKKIARKPFRKTKAAAEEEKKKAAEIIPPEKSKTATKPEELKKEKAEKTPEAVEKKKEVKAKETVAEKEVPVGKPKKKDEKAVEEIVKEPAKQEVKKEAVEVKKEAVEEKKAEEQDSNFIKTKYKTLSGPTILGKIELPPEKKPGVKKPVASSSDDKLKAKKKRKRIRKSPVHGAAKPQRGGESKGRFRDKKGRKDTAKPELSEEEIQKQIKETLQRLTTAGKSKGATRRKQKRDKASKQIAEEELRQEKQSSTIQVTEFVTANELANMLNVQVNEIISTCMSLGLFVSINQRLDAETLSLVAEEFGSKVEFVSVEVQEAIEDTLAEEEENYTDRAPIVTVMGHVDHGKTLLLDQIRNTNVIAGEAGGITQHIGAYEVILDSGKSITFLDTPGHEAFTAMRARGAKVTDVAIIIIAADDAVMPQTVEAINHAQAAGVPIVFAINKIDKPNANANKIREQLSNMNILLEDWGGKFQSQEISAKQGTNIDQLLEKVLLEAEMLELKANPDKLAIGSVIESSLDKGRGYVAKVLVQNGTLRVGDMVLAGSTYGRVKALYNERNQLIEEAGPSSPVLMLGLNGAPQAGDSFNHMTDERKVKATASKRLQLQREQGLRTQKHITLDEIGRRIAIGDFKELNVIIKADVDGSVEALTDELLKLSTAEVQVNVIHKDVGAITESDVLLASASNAVIVGFNVRPTVKARKLAEQEQIDIRLYSVIYNAVNEIKDAIEGMLSPKVEEKIICNIEVREVFKITKVGTVAGCMVLDGKVSRNTRIRLIRDGIVVYSGLLGSLKRFKDDAKEVQSGYECGLNIENFNDIKVGDIIEGYEEVEVKRTL